MGKDPKWSVAQVVLLRMSEESWQERRGRHLGRSTLMQQAYICASAMTFEGCAQAPVRDLHGFNRDRRARSGGARLTLQLAQSPS